MVYTIYKKGVDIMTIAKVFENGRSQAVRIPKEYRFNTHDKWSSFLQAIDIFSDDFMATGRDDNLEQEREKL